MIAAISVKTKVIITIADPGSFRLERQKKGSPDWLTYTAAGFIHLTENSTEIPQAVGSGDVLDNFDIGAGLYTYRCVPFANTDPQPKDWDYSNWVRCGSFGPLGYSFGNYSAPPGKWGNAVCPDDLRYTYLWGNDFKATNGSLFTDEQIQFYIDAAVADMERRLNITIKKRRVRCEVDKNNLKKGVDYDVEEGYYEFSYARIARHGTIVTNKKPIIKLHRLDLINRYVKSYSALDTTIVDKTKGVLKLMRRPIRPSDTLNGIATAIYPYGSETFSQHLFYAIDYDAGYETSDDIPDDLREAIAKTAAVSLLNSIGDGLMAGFSSSSVGMDGMNESFSSTQCATSAYFGARIKVYEDELKEYIENVRLKFGHIQIGVI
jgi:hypothetical protein